VEAALEAFNADARSCLSLPRFPGHPEQVGLDCAAADDVAAHAVGFMAEFVRHVQRRGGVGVGGGDRELGTEVVEGEGERSGSHLRTDPEAVVRAGDPGAGSHGSEEWEVVGGELLDADWFAGEVDAEGQRPVRRVPYGALVPEVLDEAMAELLCGVICPARGERRVFGIVDAALGDRRESRDRLVVGRAQQGACQSFRCCSIVFS
jgi:general stress protein YciG